MFVYVINCHGHPLMPCHPRKARLLLKAGKAKVAKMVPFTIQLLYGSSGYKQAISLGVDAGTHQIGLSATTEQQVLFEAEVLPRSDIQELLSTRRQFRRARRSRKTRYRKVRFLNRKKSAGWLAPSVRNIVEAHHLEKSHLIDARCISTHPCASSDGTWYLLKCVRRNNRQLHKATIRKGGKRQRNTAPKAVHGFRLFDCVRYEQAVCFVFGRRSNGYFDRRTLNGTKIHASASCKKLTMVQKASALLVERRAAFPPVA